MKKNLLYILFCFLSVSARAQTLSPKVISSAGNYSTAVPGISWSWTLGDTYTPTIQNGTNMLSQGFQQPEVQILTGTFTNPICSGDNFTLPFTSYSVIGSNNVYTAQLSDASGSFASPVNVGTTTGNTSGTINVTIPSNTASGNYKIRVVASLPVFNTNDPGVDIIIVATSAASAIISTPETTICAGTPATFTVVPQNGGTTPTYQWQVDGSNVGTNSSTFSSTSISQGDIVTCIVTSNAACVTGSPATSNTIPMTVNPALRDSVDVSPNPGATICSGTSVTFTATPFNPGTNPVYEWKLNGNTVGTNSTTYTNGGLNSGDVVTCTLTSNATCVTGSPATSNGITMAISSTIPLNATVNPSSNNICSGINVDFTATTNGGVGSNYQWQVNGNNVGTNSNTFSSTSINNGDIITCIVSSSGNCITGSPVTSNSVPMTVTQSQVASVDISSPNTSICSGTTADFTATPGTGNLNPTYQWQVNGNNVGTNSTAFSSSSLNSGDVVTCTLTSSATCVTGSPATSNPLTITINSNSVAGTISSPKTTICQNTLGHFNLSGNSGGGIQWQSSADSLSGYTPITGATAVTYTTQPISQSTYYRVIVGSGTCADTSAPLKLTVEPAPTASYTYVVSGQKVTFDGSPSSGATSYTWDFGDGTTSTDQKPVHTFDSVKIYHVCLTVKNSSNCNFTVCQNVETFHTGINNLRNDASWLVYPDPFSSQLYIATTGQAAVNVESIEMYDLLGRKVFHQPINRIMDNPTKIDVPGLINGVYFLNIRMKDGSFVKSVVKQS